MALRYMTLLRDRMGKHEPLGKLDIRGRKILFQDLGTG
jgi:hypothetical protein